MHISLATHFCMGEFASMKVSMSGETATCGMEEQNQTCPGNHKGISSDCCQNEIVAYSTDNNFETSSFQINKTAENLLQIFVIPVSIALNSIISTDSFKPNVVPPDIALASDVSLADICIFRI
jgi:hypothetical protein